MAKKRKPVKAAAAGVLACKKQDVKAANPFEQFHTKRRFDIIGAAPKASKHKPVQLTKARAAAINKV